MKYLTDTGAGSVDIEGKTCAEAWALIDGQWEAEINAYALPFAHTMYPKLSQAAAGAKLAADVPLISQLLTGTATGRNQFLKQKSVVDAFEAAQLDFGNADSDSFALQRADAVGQQVHVANAGHRPDGDQVVTAADRMQHAQFRHRAQGGDHRGHLLGMHGDHDVRTQVAAVVLVMDADGVTADHPLAFQPLDPALHRGPREVQPAGDLGGGGARVLTEH